MKANRSFLLTFLLSALFLLGSCSDKDKDEDKGGAKNTENWAINEWIYDEMSEKYFWEDKIPSQSSLDFNLVPDQFFYSTLYRYNLPDGDRFSILYKDGLPQYKDRETTSVSNRTKHNEIGFEFQAFIDNKGVIEFVVTYIKKGTEAEKQGLKRGDWITAVDGVTMNDNNWRSILLTGKASYVLTLKDKGSLSLKTTATHDENPVHTYNIIPDTRIGYVLYNSFANGKDDNSYNYALEMNNEVLKSFEGNIDELILDLRYNGGGLVQSGTYIASAIVPDRTGKIYTRRNYNSTLEKIPSYYNDKNNYFYNEITAGGAKHAIPKLNLKRLYVITSKYTASASEQIINGLRAYMTVQVIGETTTGKNMESFPITGKNEASKWVLHALTSVSYRSDKEAKDNDYSKGFRPTLPTEGREISEINFYEEGGKLKPYPIYELGNPKELLLSIVLDNIKGKSGVRRNISTLNTGDITPIGSSLDRKSNDMIIENRDIK